VQLLSVSATKLIHKKYTRFAASKYSTNDHKHGAQKLRMIIQANIQNISQAKLLPIKQI